MQAAAAPLLIGATPDSRQAQPRASDWKVIEPVIELAITQANALGAYVYHFDRERTRADLSAFVGPAPLADTAAKLSELAGPAVAFHRERRTPIVIHQGAATDWRFAALPEFRSGRFDGVVSVPLIGPGGMVGIANFCRTQCAAIKARDLAFLVGLSAPLATLLTASTLRDKLQRASQLLADRKLLARAKGLLQETVGCSEEDAYLRIRLLSRQRQTPMREISRQVIEAGGHSEVFE
jgi:GAF domain-containing protein